MLNGLVDVQNLARKVKSTALALLAKWPVRENVTSEWCFHAKEHTDWTDAQSSGGKLWRKTTWFVPDEHIVWAEVRLIWTPNH